MPNYHPVDVHVGERIRRRRVMLDLSQTDLGRALDVSFQQIQKYERGMNRISSSFLYEAAIFLRAPVSFFFAGFSKKPIPSGSREARKHARDDKLSGETLRLVRAYYSIRSTYARRCVSNLVQTLGETSAEGIKVR